MTGAINPRFSAATCAAERRIWAARKTVLATVVAAAMATAGCTSLPTDSDPQALRSFEPGVDVGGELTPEPGREPDLLLRDFFTASANPTKNHASARNFMTPEAAGAWKDSPEPTTGAIIVDRVDLNAKGTPRDGAVGYTVRGEVVGYLGEGGVYQPEHASFEAEMSLKRVDGEWRIASLPDGVIIEMSELSKQYQPRDIYFFDPKFQRLVADRRWVYSDQESLDTTLLTLLAAGPREALREGVKTVLPTDSTFIGKQDSAYEFTGLQTLSSEERQLFSAQVAWTLARSDIADPYAITSDGLPLSAGSNTTELSDVAEFNPFASAAVSFPLYAVAQGELFSIENDTPARVSTQGDTKGVMQSADVFASSESVAAVYSTDPSVDEDPEVSGVDESVKDSTLYYGAFDAPMKKALDGRSITRPTFAADGNAIWSVVDGTTVVRTARSTSTGEIANTEVDIDELWEQIDAEEESRRPPITALRLSPTGVRAAFIVQGDVYLATVVPEQPGEYKLTAIHNIAPSLGNQATTLDWTPTGALIVGTKSQESPVWQISTDGSETIALPSGNITAPVRGVAASNSTYVVADQHSVLQLPVGGNSTFWREVPALQGTRAVPVVAR
ncbi:Lipoprotein LpqB precursor [Corynebacterium ciconiae DSM 44920]|uniref:MtrAB system accessory lipoprotein LpqB n=1 Tax=Corynebacterium ciconiae TaxID=227319 RepID=UPI00036A9CC1|nr:MtrAB system accessory lipoprotein LpqB [Corynebacterium ciconiae]WKD61803.1 Lipoprotein LpqB precursor [Corynebacterium ciconiae DSM 44920]